MTKRRPRCTAVASLLFVAIAFAAPRAAALPPGADSRPAGDRPAVLFPLYVSFGALQAVDVHSTLAALNSGGREANPLFGSAMRSPVAIIALKSAGAATVVIASERLWKTHRIAAVLMMVGVNAGYALVAAHNYGVARAGR
jgi:uncharacterized protein DUF5658